MVILPAFFNSIPESIKVKKTLARNGLSHSQSAIYPRVQDFIDQI